MHPQRTIVRRTRSQTAQAKHKHAHSKAHAREWKPELNVPAGWIDADLPQHQLIARAHAVRQYRLRPSELKRLSYRTGVSLDGHPVHLYNERSVEAIAWDRYGGPSGLWKRLKLLRDHHINVHGDASSFPAPFSYQRGRKYDLTLPRAPPDPRAYDPYVGRSQRLQQAKGCLPSWLWLACNAALDRAALHDAQSELGGGQPVLSDSRKEAMLRAVRFARGYPPREQARSGALSSPWIVCFRNVLRSAPKLPPRRAWGTQVDGLEFVEAPSRRRGHGHYEWSEAYIKRVLKVLRRVFAAHGDRPSVRQCVLLEIYDAYSRSLSCGIRYDPIAKTWLDPAAAWLEISGQSPAGVVQDALRSKRPVGLRRVNHNFLPSPTPSPRKGASVSDISMC